MATISTNYAHQSPAAVSATEHVTAILRWTFGLVPIVAGADKFMHLLTDWTKYLAPAVAQVLPFSPDTFMQIVGVIEIVAGILVLIKPRLGSIIVCLWLLGIAVNLLMTGQYFDVAVRDTVMAISAFCLYLLSGERISDRSAKDV